MRELQKHYIGAPGALVPIYHADAVDLQLALMQRAIDWINENAELSSNEDGVHLTVLDASKQYRQWLKVPAEFADIIRPAREE